PCAPLQFFRSVPHPRPRSLLFPYPTPFRPRLEPQVVPDLRARARSPHEVEPVLRRVLAVTRHDLDDVAVPELVAERLELAVHARSEEHTSELQSLTHLLCRLLPRTKKAHSI